MFKSIFKNQVIFFYYLTKTVFYDKLQYINLRWKHNFNLLLYKVIGLVENNTIAFKFLFLSKM